MEIKRSIDVSVNTYDYVYCPDTAEVVITPYLIERAIKLHQAVVDLKVYKIVEFYNDSKITWFSEGLEDETEPWDGRVETLTLNVAEEHIFWRGYLKGTSINVETSSISLEELKEIKKVLDTSVEDLPLMIDTLTFDTSKDTLSIRLSK